MVDKPDDLARLRWQKKTKPKDHQPVEAVKRCLEAIESGKIKPRHVIIIFTDDEKTGWFQAGEETHFGQIGLLAKAQQIMLNDED